MKFWKSTFLTIVAFLGVASTVLYTSCEKDSCTDLKCRNGGSCAEGFCRCQTGFEGAECEIKTADRYLGLYYGYTHCDNDPSILDTLHVWLAQEPNVLEFHRYGAFTDYFTGVAMENNTIVVPQNGDKYVTVKLDHDELTMHTEQPVTPGGSLKSVCIFVGTKAH